MLSRGDMAEGIQSMVKPWTFTNRRSMWWNLMARTISECENARWWMHWMHRICKRN